jgi:hypothetical protein
MDGLIDDFRDSSHDNLFKDVLDDLLDHLFDYWFNDLLGELLENSLEYNTLKPPVYGRIVHEVVETLIHKLTILNTAFLLEFFEVDLVLFKKLLDLSASCNLSFFGKSAWF